MAKIDSYRVDKAGRQLQDFCDDVTELLDFGKYSSPVVTSVPAWDAGEGEFAFYNVVTPATDRRIYVRLYSSWVVFSQILGSGSGPGGGPAGPESAIQYNSGGAFGGDSNFIWNASALFVAVTGDIIISQSCLLVGAPNAVKQSGMVRAIILGNGGPGDPVGQTNTTSIYAGDRGGQTTRSGLFVAPEVGGPHYFGDFCGINMSSPTVALEVHPNANPGRNWNGISGSAYTFNYLGTGQAAQLAYDAYPPVAGSVQDLIIEVDNSVTESSILMRKQNNNGQLTREIPAIVFGDRLNASGPVFLGNSFTFGSSQTLVNYRTYQFWAPTIYSAGSSNITNAATVFISGAPVQSGTMTAVNNYALWVSGGTVRIGGDLAVDNISIVSGTSAKGIGVFFSTSSFHVSSNSTTQNELIRAIVGTTSLVANTLSEGRTIRLSAMGYYNTPAAPGTIIFSVALSGITILTTSSQTLVGNASTLGWQLEALITCQTTGGAGTVFAQGRVPVQSANTAWNCLQMINSSSIVINTTGENPIHLYAQWGTAAAASQVYATSIVGELLN